MKKRRRLMTGMLMGAVMLVGCGSQERGQPVEKEIVTIDGTQVFQDEFRLLLKENYFQYERKLCDEYQIPADEEPADYFGGEEKYLEKIAEKNIEKLCRIKVQQNLAGERGLAEDFKWEAFLKDLEEENARRAEKVKNGEAIYGVTSFREEEFYTYQMDATINKLKNDVLKNEGGDITQEEIWEYYQNMKSPLSGQGETYRYTLCNVNELMNSKSGNTGSVLRKTADILREGTWQDEKYLEVEEWQFPLETRDLNQEELRELVRPELEGESILALLEGEVSKVLSLEDAYWLVRYEGIQKAKSLSNTDQESVKSMILEERYEAYIDEQAKEAEVEIQEEALENFIKTEGGAL